MRVLLLSDVHANEAPLRAVLKAVPDVDMICCLGDVVAYGPNPSVCVDLIRESADHAVLGNHDAEIVGWRQRASNRLSAVTNDARWKRWTFEQLRPDQIDYLASLPEEISLTLDGRNVLLRHTVPGPDPLLGHDSPIEELELGLTGMAFDDMFVGHVHHPYRRTMETRRVINVGSVGQSEHGQGNASFVVWDDGAVVFHKAEYDVAKTIADFEKLGLDPAYVQLWSKFWKYGYVDRAALAELRE